MCGLLTGNFQFFFEKHQWLKVGLLTASEQLILLTYVSIKNCHATGNIQNTLQGAFMFTVLFEKVPNDRNFGCKIGKLIYDVENEKSFFVSKYSSHETTFGAVKIASTEFSFQTIISESLMAKFLYAYSVRAEMTMYTHAKTIRNIPERYIFEWPQICMSQDIYVLKAWKIAAFVL